MVITKMKFWMVFFVAMLGEVLGENLRVPLCDSGNTTISSYLESSGCNWDDTICCYESKEDVDYVSAYVLANCSKEVSFEHFCMDEGDSWWDPIKIFLLSFAGVVFAVAIYGECS
jgi:hypothetical protein